jgi:bifunctional non-homologous end joining protein LigD
LPPEDKAAAVEAEKRLRALDELLDKPTCATVLPSWKSTGTTMARRISQTTNHPKRNRRNVSPGASKQPDLQDAPKAPMPKNVRPMLATLVEKPFDRRGWLFEIKWDGYRTIAEIDNGRIRLYSRNGLSFTERYHRVAKTLEQIKHQVVLDGEVVVLDASGHSDFEALQNYRSHRSTGQLAYFVFDLLNLDGHDLRGLPLIRRKAILQQILPTLPNVVFCEHIEDQGLSFFDAVAKAGLEGMVAKDATSKYLAGRRSDCWLKIKAYLRQEAVIGGFTRPRNSRQHFGALVLGVYEGGELVHIGEVGGGFSEKRLAQVATQLAPLVQTQCPFRAKPRTKESATWVRPELVCEVRFTAWTGGYLRHPTFQGLRDDKTAGQISREAHAELSRKPSSSVVALTANRSTLQYGRGTDDSINSPTVEQLPGYRYRPRPGWSAGRQSPVAGWSSPRVPCLPQ